MLPFETIESLRFLALPQAEKVAYLPADAEELFYTNLDGDIELSYPAELIALSVGKAIDLDIWATRPESPNQLLIDINCVIAIMFDIGEFVSTYHWRLNKVRCSITGPHDGMRLVLARLATLALHEYGLELSPPNWTFADFLTFAEFECRTRPVADSE